MTVIYSEAGGGDRGRGRGRASGVQQLGPELQLLAKILPNHHQVPLCLTIASYLTPSADPPDIRHRGHGDWAWR